MFGSGLEGLISQRSGKSRAINAEKREEEEWQ